MALLPQLISADRRAQLASFDPRWRLKLSLHATTILFSFISIILFAAAIPQWNSNFFHNKGPMRGDWTDGISIGPLTFGILFSTLCIIHFFSRQKALPPRVCIVIFTLVVVSLTPALFLAGHGSLFRHWRAPAVRNQNGVLVCNLLNVFARECEPVLYTIGELQIGGVVFGILVWVSTFVLLLVSVYEIRAQKVTKSRLPRRLTMTISDMEKGYRRNRDREHKDRQRRSRRHGHRQHGTERHYTRSREENSDTVPIINVQEPPAAHAFRGARGS